MVLNVLSTVTSLYLGLSKAPVSVVFVSLSVFEELGSETSELLSVLITPLLEEATDCELVVLTGGLLVFVTGDLLSVAFELELTEGAGSASYSVMVTSSI